MKEKGAFDKYCIGENVVTVHPLFGGKYNALVFDKGHENLTGASPVLHSHSEAMTWAHGFLKGLKNDTQRD